MDHYHYLRKQTHARVARSCSGEMEREVHSILGPIGVKEGLSRLIANDLRTVEEESLENASRASGSSSKSWWKIWKREGGIRLEEDGGSPGGDPGDMGLTAFLLKFGEGMGEVPTCSSSIAHANHDRGGPTITTVHFGIHNRVLILYRRSHPTRSVHVCAISRTRLDCQLYLDRCCAPAVRSIQDVLHVSSASLLPSQILADPLVAQLVVLVDTSSVPRPHCLSAVSPQLPHSGSSRSSTRTPHRSRHFHVHISYRPHYRCIISIIPQLHC